MTTTNEMIYKTLRTKTDKPAKFAEQLREMGYEVKATYEAYGKEYESDYWAVNGLHVCKYEGETAYLSLRSQCIERLDALKPVDFENYFATLDARTEKAERMAAHDNIEQRHSYGKDTFTVRVKDGEGRWNYHHEERTRRWHRMTDTNHEISRYKTLKNKADGFGYGWVPYDRRTDVQDAERDLDRAEKALAEAQEKVEKARKALEKALADEVKHGGELNEFLTARGIRKEVA